MQFNLAGFRNIMPVTLVLSCHWLVARASSPGPGPKARIQAGRDQNHPNEEKCPIYISVHFGNPEDLQNIAPQI